MRTPEENKALCEKYPFLKYSDDPDDDYEYTYADDIPEGWWIAFGEMMCEEIKAELIRCNFLDEYRIVQAKDKYAGLRIYDNGVPKGCKVWDIIEKYSVLSQNICGVCGRPDVPVMTWGWEYPLCRDHAQNPEEYQECARKQYPHNMSQYRKWSSLTDGKWVDHDEYIGDTANRIREAWRERNANHINGEDLFR